MSFYVYTYWRREGRQWIPFYVGKGQGRRVAVRAHRSAEFLVLLEEIEAQKLRPRITYEPFDDEAAAYAREVELIALYGRLDNGTGVLVNKTAGGEGMREVWFTEEMRSAARAQMAALKANPAVEATRRAKSAAAQRRQATREARSASLRSFYSDPAEIERRKGLAKSAWESGIGREKHAQSLAASWNRADVREKRIQGIKLALEAGGAEQRSKTMKSHFAGANGDGRRAKIKADSLARWQDEAFRRNREAKMLLMWERRHRAAGKEEKAIECRRRADEILASLAE